MRVALITGASSGIGRAVAIELCKMGYYVINASRRREAKEGGPPTDELTGGRFIRADLSRLGDVKKLVDEVDAVHVLVNNAGFMYLTDDYTEEMFDNMLNVTLKAPFFLTKWLIDLGKLVRGGVVVFISSTAGIYGDPEDIPYAASKAGLIAMAKSFAKRYRDYRFVVIAPGMVETWLLGDPKASPPPKELIDKILVGRVGRPEEVAKLVAHVVENEFVNAVTIVIDGGRDE